MTEPINPDVFIYEENKFLEAENRKLREEIITLNQHIATLASEVLERKSWQSVLTDQLLHREQQIAGIKEALGDDAASQHPGYYAARERMRAILLEEEDNTDD